MDFYQQRQAITALADSKAPKGSGEYQRLERAADAAVAFAAVATASALDRIALALDSLAAQHGAS